jgi:hypothetical protein
VSSTTLTVPEANGEPAVQLAAPEAGHVPGDTVETGP